jgi:chromate transporter
MERKERLSNLWQVALLFLKMSVISFGGPAAHIALMEEEVVNRRQWLSRQHFLDLVGATNLIPGPNATEMAIHVGFIRAGWPGLILAGVCFVVPAALITLGFGWAYVRYGALPEVAPFLYGIKPAILAIIILAMYRLGKTAVKSWPVLLIGLVVLAASLLGLNEILALFGGGILGMFWLRWMGARKANPPQLSAMLYPFGLGFSFLAARGLQIAAEISLWKLGLFFLKVGAMLYGSGYVLIAFLQGGLVHDYGWLTQQQLLDAIAVGQFTPGPLLSTATFIGYLLRGVPGATLATVAVFFPSFVFTALLNPVVPRLRRSPWTSAFLDAVNISSLALMASVSYKLAGAVLVAWPAWLILLAAVLISLRWKPNPTWLVVGGAAIGWLLQGLI